MDDENGVTRALVELKNKQRAALRAEYWKQKTNPYTQKEGGYVFDPALQRFLSMNFTRVEHFKETPKSISKLFFILLLPLAGTMYLFKTDREKKEALYRSGTVAYKDRIDKFS